MKSPSKSRATAVALSAAVAFLAAGGVAVSAQEKPPIPAPKPAETPAPRPAAKDVDEPAKPAPSSTGETDAAIRALVDELAKLRTEIAEMRKSQAAVVAAPKPSLVQPIPPDDPAAIAARTPPPAPAPKMTQPRPVVTTPTDAVLETNETESYVEPEVPVFYEGDVPVYIRRNVYSDCDPTLISTTYLGCDPWYYWPSHCGTSWSCAPWYSHWRPYSCASSYSYARSWSCAPRAYSVGYVGGCSTSYRGYNVPRSRSYVVGGGFATRRATAFQGGARFTTHSSSPRFQQTGFRGSSVRTQGSFGSSMRGGRRSR